MFPFLDGDMVLSNTDCLMSACFRSSTVGSHFSLLKQLIKHYLIFEVAILGQYKSVWSYSDGLDYVALI